MEEVKKLIDKFESQNEAEKQLNKQFKKAIKNEMKRYQNHEKDHNGVMEILSSRHCFLCPNDISGYYFNEFKNNF